MTEGELKKRMRKLYNPHWESVKIIDADKLEKVVEEMKADFPKLKPITIDPNGTIEERIKTAQYQSEKNATDYINEAEEWFVKWLGEKKEATTE